MVDHYGYNYHEDADSVSCHFVLHLIESDKVILRLDGENTLLQNSIPHQVQEMFKDHNVIMVTVNYEDSTSTGFSFQLSDLNVSAQNYKQ